MDEKHPHELLAEVVAAYRERLISISGGQTVSPAVDLALVTCGVKNLEKADSVTAGVLLEGIEWDVVRARRRLIDPSVLYDSYEAAMASRYVTRCLCDESDPGRSLSAVAVKAIEALAEIEGAAAQARLVEVVEAVRRVAPAELNPGAGKVSDN